MTFLDPDVLLIIVLGGVVGAGLVLRDP